MNSKLLQFFISFSFLQFSCAIQLYDSTGKLALFVSCFPHIYLNYNCSVHRLFMEPAKMSTENSSDRVYYVHCNFCNTILVVNVPCNSLFNIVTVRCGHCANLLSVNVGALLQSFNLQDFQKQHPSHASGVKDIGSSSRSNMLAAFQAEHVQPKTTPIQPPEKRQRVPSAYNRFIKEEIQRIKASNPEISHREAFSTAAKNWAHFPHIHFGLNLETSNK